METSKICTLCDNVLNKGETQVLNGLFMEMLDVLLINLNINERNDNSVCNICIDKIRSAFNFKTICIETMDCLIPYIGTDGKLTVDLKTVYLRERQIEPSEIVHEHDNICRLCMKLIPMGPCMLLMELLEELHFLENFEKYVPEVALSAIENAVICDSCFISLQQLSDLIFMTTCFNVEPRPHNNLEKLVCVTSGFKENITENNEGREKQLSENMETTNNINDIIDTEHSNYSTLNMEILINNPNSIVTVENDSVTKIKTNITLNKIRPLEEANKFSDIEQIPSSIIEKPTILTYSNKRKVTSKHILHKSVKQTGTNESSMDNENTEIEHIDISESKQESLVIVDSDDDDVVAISSTPEVIEVKDAEDDFLVVAQNEDMSSTDGLENYTKVYECDRCLYETSDSKQMMEHLYEHQFTKYEQCPFCPCRKKGKMYLEVHMLLWHEGSVKKNPMSCKLCKYKTDYNYYLDKHLEVHNATRKYILCNKCVFKTTYKEVLREHFIHKHATPVNKSKEKPRIMQKKCPLCKFTTHYISVYVEHLSTCKKSA